MPSPEARAKLERARSKRVGFPQAKKVAIWTALVSGFAGVYSFHTTAGESAVAAGVLAATVLAVAIPFGVRRRRTAAKLEAALGKVARGLDVPSLSLASASPWQRVTASHYLADAAWKRGDPKAALEHCDRGFHEIAIAQGGRVEPLAAAGMTWELPRLLSAQRASALAALGLTDEAWAEVAWANGYPAELTVLRVALLARLRRSDYEGAAAVIERRASNQALPPRDEALALMARFLGRPAARSAKTVAELRAEFRRDAGLETWVDAIAPGLRTAFESAATGVAEVRAAAV
jgi:hypothetical protein